MTSMSKLSPTTAVSYRHKMEAIRFAKMRRRAFAAKLDEWGVEHGKPSILGILVKTENGDRMVRDKDYILRDAVGKIFHCPAESFSRIYSTI